MGTFNWCFVGTGTLANFVAEQILATGRHKIVSCYTRSFEKGKEFGDRYGCQAYETLKEAVCAKDVDGVYVVTPHNVHYRNVKEILELGKPVLCEKAFTVEAGDTDELIRLAKEKDLYLCEAMWTWFGPGALKAREIIDSGRLGRILSADFTFNCMAVNYAPRVSDPKRAGGAILDIGVYPLTYAYNLFGAPEDFCCKGRIENGIDYAIEIDATFPENISVRIQADINDPDGDEMCVIRGEKGTLEVPGFHCNNIVRVVLTDGVEEMCCADKPELDYIPEFDAVAAEISQGLKESKYVPLRSTSDIMHIMDKCRAQMGLVYDSLE